MRCRLVTYPWEAAAQSSLSSHAAGAQTSWGETYSPASCGWCLGACPGSRRRLGAGPLAPVDGLQERCTSGQVCQSLLSSRPYTDAWQDRLHANKLPFQDPALLANIDLRLTGRKSCTSRSIGGLFLIWMGKEQPRGSGEGLQYLQSSQARQGAASACARHQAS